jgi:replicative DNA helicase
VRHEQTELGYAVLFCTLEMPREQLVMRIASHEAEFDAGLWRRPRVTEEAWQKIFGSFDKLKDLPVYVDDTVALTLGELRAKVRRLKRQVERTNADGTALIPSKPLKLVVVDYLQLMKGQREKGDTREREVASLSNGLKNLAKQENIVVIAVSQLNRELEKQKDRRPQLKDLRESGALEADADNIYFLYRESYYDRNTTERLSAELDVAKQRNGPSGLVELIFRQEYTRYYSAAGEVGDEFDDYYDDG